MANRTAAEDEDLTTGARGNPDPSRQLGDILDHLSAVVWEMDPETWEFSYVSQYAVRLVGYPLERWRTLGFWAERIHPEDRERTVNECRRSIAAGEDHFLEYRMVHADGHSVWVRDSVRVHTGDDGKATLVSGILFDISHLKETERAWRVSEQRFTRFAEASTEGVIVHDNGKVLEVNGAGTRMLGYSAEEMVGMPATMFCPSEERPRLLKHIAEGSEDPLIGKALRKDGTTFDVEIVGRNITLLGEAIRVVSMRDISKRMNAERALAAVELDYGTLFDEVSEAIVLTDENLCILRINRSACEMSGMTDAQLRGRHLKEFVDPTDLEANPLQLDSLPPGQSLRVERVLRAPTGEQVIADISAKRLPDGRVLASVHDVTERRQLERRLGQTQKLELIGGVAGGIAHDFNNILTAIRAFSELAIGSLPPSNPAREDVTEILKASDRAIALTRQLLTFSRQEVQNVRTISVNTVISDVAPMLRRLAGDRHSVLLDLSNEPGLVNADWGQIEQVLVNLVVNARDAMPKGGEIRVTTSNTTMPEDRDRPDLPSGDLVVISVSDTGIGIDEQTRERMFEPFFTTKIAQGGTGLGLSTVYGIVKQSSGAIDVESVVGKGTTFRILLPRVSSR